MPARVRKLLLALLVPTLAAAVIVPLAIAAQAAITCTTAAGRTQDFTGGIGSWTPRNEVNGAGKSFPSQCLRMSVPSTALFDSWTGFDNAYAIETTVAANTNFTVETRLDLNSATPAAGGTHGPIYHTGLSIRFGTTDTLLWGLWRAADHPAARLRADRTGPPVSGAVNNVWQDGTTVSLQIQKVGTTYTFLHRAADNQPWTYDGTYVTDDTPSHIGVFIKTFPPPTPLSPYGTAVTTDFDYVDLFTGPATTNDCLTANATADSRDWGTPWTVYRPVAGPRLFLNAPAPNSRTDPPTAVTFDDAQFACQRLYIPPDRTYDYWGNGANLDQAPQRLRTDIDTGTWSMETELNLGLNASKGTANSHVGLLVKFGTYDAFIWGKLGGALHLHRTGTGTIYASPPTYPGSQVFLRVERTATDYLFRYKSTAGGAWTTAYTVPVAGLPSVQAVGLIGKTWSVSTTAVIADFNYLDLTRAATVDNGTISGASCLGVGHAYDFKTALGAGWTTEKTGSYPTLPDIAVAMPGCARVRVPNNATYDQWNNPQIDNAPKLTRTDMGTADWTIETKVILRDYPANFHTGLMVRFSQYDMFLFGPLNGTGVALHRTGDTPPSGPNGYAEPVVHLRAQKSGSTYTFSQRSPGALAWTTTATRTGVTNPVTAVGLFTKTFTTPGTVAVDFDHFDLAKRDDVTGAAVSADWTALPITGPTWTVTGGAIRLALNGTFTHSGSQDNAPQLRRPGPTGGFAMEAKVTLVNNPLTAFQTGLFVRLSQFDLIYFGFTGQTGTGLDLTANRTGAGGPVITNTASTVYLRIERVGSSYLFFHRTAPGAVWRYDGNLAGLAATPTHVGLIGLTTASRSLTVDFDEFALTSVSGS